MALILTDQNGNEYTLSVNATDGSLSVSPFQGSGSPSAGDDSIWQTALQLITSALRLIGVLASGETASADEANDSLMVLKQMMDAWNADRLTIFSIQYADYPFVLGQQAYKLGPGGDFNTNRPARIVGMSSILLTNPATPIEVPITMYTAEDWQREMPLKQVDSSFPQVCYDDQGFPQRTLNFWPIPTQANSVRIYSWGALATTWTLQSAINLPPGYAEALRFNLAVRLSAEFAAPLSPTVSAIASDTLSRLKTMNAPKLSMKSDLMATDAGYNYKADMFGVPF